MISKKDALTLGVLAVAGVAAAGAVAGGDGDGAVMEGLRGVKGRAGGILGSATPPSAVPTVFQVPAQAEVTFPTPVDYSGLLEGFMMPKKEISRGAAGVPAAGRQRPVSTPARAIVTPKAGVGIGAGVLPSGEMGFAPSPGYIPGVGYGVGMYPVATAETLYPGRGPQHIYSGGTTSKKNGAATGAGAKEAISMAKRLRAGRGD